MTVRAAMTSCTGSRPANCAIKAGDFNAARTVIDTIVAGSKGATNDFARVRLKAKLEK